MTIFISKICDLKSFKIHIDKRSRHSSAMRSNQEGRREKDKFPGYLSSYITRRSGREKKENPSIDSINHTTFHSHYQPTRVLLFMLLLQCRVFIQ